jgi:hypothetical protein
MKLTYYRAGLRREVFITFHQATASWALAPTANGVVGLGTPNTELVRLHYARIANQARPYLRRVGPWVWEFWQWLDTHIRATAEMVTLLLMPAQLADVVHDDADWTAV